MKFFAVALALAASAAAQNIFVSVPAANSTVFPGQQLTVEVDKPVRFPVHPTVPDCTLTPPI